MNFREGKLIKLILSFLILFGIPFILSLVVPDTFTFNGTTIVILSVTFLALGLGILTKKD